MRLFVYCLLVAVPCAGFGQELSKEDKEKEAAFQKKAAEGADTTTARGWAPALTTNLNLTQVSFKDWAPGGENSLSYALGLIGGAVHTAERTTWSNNLKMAFGQTRLGSQGLRKTDDEIYFESLLIYQLGSVINPYVSATVRTQFAPGYRYADDGSSTEVSRFFDPGYLTQSAGVAWQPSSIFTERIGVALREIVTSRHTGYSRDPDTGEEKTFRVVGGPESVTTLEWPFAENMKLSSRLELFAPFNKLDRVIVRNDNVITASVNRYINVSFNVQVINDVNVSPRTQIKQTLSLGFTYNAI